MIMIENNIELLPDFKVRLLKILDKYRDLGEIVHPNGTMSIGKIPGKQKWFLIHLYAGTDQKRLSVLENKIKLPIPLHLKKFYTLFNGMTLFGAGQFRLWGFPEPARKDMPNYQAASFFIADPKVELGIHNALDDIVFFGGYVGYLFYTKTDIGRVYACKIPDATPIEQWDNIEVMILDVAERLSHWFDENAQPIDPIVNEQPVLFETPSL